MQKQKISTHPRIVDYSYSTSTVMFALLILLLLACVRRESKRMMCWGRSTCRRHQRPSLATGSYANIRGDVPMTVVQWCSTPKRWWIMMVHHFLQWFGTERKLKKKVVARCKQATNHETEGLPLLYILWRWVSSFRVVIYCVLAMGPGQTPWRCSLPYEREEKSFVCLRSD